MFEETNQADFTPNTSVDTTPATTPVTTEADSSSEDFFNFADFAEDGANQPSQEQSAEGEETATDGPAAQTPDPKAEATAAPTPAGEKAKLKHMGKEVELSHDELVTAAQKGLDYDRIRSERDELRNAPEFKLIDEEAARYGLTRSEYVERAKLAQATQEVKQKYPDISDEAALEIAELKLQDVRVKNLKDSYDQQAQLAEQKNKLRDSFSRIMLDNKLNVMPDEVIELVGNGQSPEIAWAIYENKQLKTKLAALEQNDKNRKSAAPSLKDNQKEAYDPFLDGFLKK